MKKDKYDYIIYILDVIYTDLTAIVFRECSSRFINKQKNLFSTFLQVHEVLEESRLTQLNY